MDLEQAGGLSRPQVCRLAVRTSLFVLLGRFGVDKHRPLSVPLSMNRYG